MNEKVELDKKDEHHYTNWFSFMLSLPLKKSLSKVDTFTQWSGLVMYFPVGFLSLCIPQLLINTFKVKPGQYGTGMTRVIGLELMGIAFFYWVFSRTKPRLSSESIALGTTVERIFYVNGALFSIYRRQLVPPLMLLIIGTVDFVLSVITLFIWLKTSKNASIKSYFCSLAQLVSFSSKRNYSSYAVQLLGLVQFIGAIGFLSLPEAASQMIQVSTNLHPHQKGLLLLVMVGSGAIATLNLFAGGADSKAYNIAVVVFSISCTLPLVAVLGWLHLIPIGLAQYLLCLDGIGVVLIALTLCLE